MVMKKKFKNLSKSPPDNLVLRKVREVLYNMDKARKQLYGDTFLIYPSSIFLHWNDNGRIRSVRVWAFYDPKIHAGKSQII